MNGYKQTDEKALKEIAVKVIDLFRSENISLLDGLYITILLKKAIVDAFKKEGDKNE